MPGRGGKPAYVNKENTGGNPITNAKATLGRVLFYDKNLSIDNTVACASCHKQEFAFSDTAIASKGGRGKNWPSFYAARQCPFCRGGKILLG